MKKLILIFVMAWGTAMLPACNSAGTSSPKDVSHDTLSHKSASAKYTCPMHPEVISNTPGTCPKCKMDLVAAESVSGKDSSYSH